MKTSILTRGAIVAIVVILAAVIIYPKLMGSKAEPPKTAEQASTGQAPTTVAQSQGEVALSAALKSGKPTMILFHSNS